VQVRNVPESSELVDGIKWLQISTTLIDGLIEPIFMKWIQEEKAWENSKINEVYHYFQLSYISPYCHAFKSLIVFFFPDKGTYEDGNQQNKGG
jgi:predicted phosphatase